MNTSRKFTSKQMGDACEMLVAAEMTLAGVPALKVPDNWPHYDVIAQPSSGPAQRVSVKARTLRAGAVYLEYKRTDEFDWLAMVLLASESSCDRSFYLVPRVVADVHARQDKPTSKTADLRYFRVDQIDGMFARFRDNFALCVAA
ncbi:hypothetical protein QOZ96_000028 [Brevundimonas nasdae]|uniref:hypothetical protein n=1 Tax=Brevundimonas nasdae TaxID=172043 RepID=UPI0019118704|nr:hypothetical protein [Brevundimonas nasdae]MBK6023456.1 hypothetical protein [Brevundimonas nasdae]MDQ0450103.1 hypothetical protein [Brevundimonas nasdae]